MQTGPYAVRLPRPWWKFWGKPCYLKHFDFSSEPRKQGYCWVVGHPTPDRFHMKQARGLARRFGGQVVA